MTASPPLDITLVSVVCKCDCVRGDVAVSYAGQERRRERNDLLTDQIVRARDTQGDYLHVHVGLTPSPITPTGGTATRRTCVCDDPSQVHCRVFSKKMHPCSHEGVHFFLCPLTITHSRLVGQSLQ